MTKQKPTLVFLIRLWPAEEGGEPPWRASLESVRTGEKHAFASLEGLFDFLKGETHSQAQALDQTDKETQDR